MLRQVARLLVVVTLSLLLVITAIGLTFVPRALAETSGWSSPFLPGLSATGDAQDSHVSLDAYGNATVAWAEMNGARSEIRASRYLVGGGWRPPEVLTNATAPNAFKPWTAMGHHGEAFVAWEEWDGRVYAIVAKRHDSVTGWSTNVALQMTALGPLYRPRVAIDPQGVGHFVWEGWDGTHTRIYWASYSPQTGWRAPLAIDGRPGEDGHYAEVAVDGQGTAIVVWYTYAGTRTNVVATRYRPGFGWDPSTFLENSGAGDAFNPVIGIDASGAGFAAWQQYSGTRWGIWVARLLTGGGWGNATEVDGRGSNATEPAVAVAASGIASVVWTEETGTRTVTMANEFRPGSGWGAPNGVSVTVPGSGDRPQVATDGPGRARAVWTQATSTGSDIYSSRTLASGGWEPPLRVSAGNATSLLPRLGVDAQGNAIAIWTELSTPPARVWAARYTESAAPTSPPGSTVLTTELLLLILFSSLGAGFVIAVVWTLRRPAK